METRIHGVPRPAVAGGLAVLAGGILWGLGIEFERIWVAAYEGAEVGGGRPAWSARDPLNRRVAEAPEAGR
jgi:hypothetical protein